MRRKNDNKSADGNGEWVAGGGLLSGLLALIGASCCVLPIVLVNIGVSAALVSHLALFARLRPFLLAATIVFIAGGVYFSFRGGRRPTRRTLTILAGAAVLAALAYILPHFEGDLLRWLRLR